MTYRYRREPHSQHILVVAIIATAFAVGSTDAFAELWSKLVTSNSARVLVTPGLLLVHTVVFWPICAAFHYVDRTGRPGFIAKHRIQEGAGVQPPMGKTIGLLLGNQFVLLPFLLFGVGELLLLRGWTAEAQLPSLQRICLELIGQAVCSLPIFYFSHRFLHRKWWMKRVHNVHHQYRTTHALAAEYAHPVEFAIGNFLTLAGGALLIGPHLISMYLFTVLGLVTILVHHCGYALPWAPWAGHHDWHHYRFREMFGTIGLLDRLFGTEPEYRELNDGDVV